MNNTSNRLGRVVLAVFFLMVLCSSWLAGAADDKKTSGGPPHATPPLTVIAIGDVGESGSSLRKNASLLNDMYARIHDGGVFQLLIFLGDNFYPIGLNVPRDQVDGQVKSILGPFRDALSGLGRSNVHALPGNHDWYARNAIEKSLLLGLVTINTAPMGLTEKGNARAAALEQWTYHYRLPAYAVYPVGGTSRDSAQFLFFDSSLLLRTDPSTWRTSLDSLQTILLLTKGRSGIVWRILCVHHPFYSVGEHGGYSVWDDEARTVQYLTGCDKDSNAIGYLKNWFDPEDLCSAKYRQYVDSLKATIRAAGVKIQVLISGHDHSLQLLHYPDRDTGYDGWPKVHIVSGAGSKPTTVKSPTPPREFTSAQAQPDNEGVSVAGFTQMRFDGELMRVVFYQGSSGNTIDMGGGRREFWVDRRGRLVEAQGAAQH